MSVLCVLCECLLLFYVYFSYLRCSRHDLVVDNFIFCITISGLSCDFLPTILFKSN